MARKGLARFIFFLFVLGVFLYGIRMVLFSSLFTIKRIDIRITGDIPKDDVKKLVDRFCRQNYPFSSPGLFKLNTKSLCRTILSDVRIDRVRIERHPPSKLIIFVVQRKPFVWISENLGVNEKGVIFPIKGTQTLPYLSGFSEKNSGDIIDVSILASIFKEAKKYPFAHKIKEISLKEKRIFFLLDNLWVCIPSKEEGLTKRFKRLEEVLKTDLSNIKLIDLSYGEDVILSSSFSF